jgi:TolA-binding protein
MRRWSLLTLTFVAACATTRYEEYGSSPPEMEGADPSAVESVVVTDRQMLEAQIRGLEQRLADLEMLINGRLDQLDGAEGNLAARVSSLSEQVQELRRQLQGAKPAVSGARVRPGTVTPDPVAPGKPAHKANVNELYERALQAFDRQAYGDSQRLFEQILTAAPTGLLADNAQYWVGECAYAVEDYTGALDAFKRVFNYTETEKDDDAQLKLGYAYLKLRDLESALIEFKRLTVDYPQSEYLSRAEEQIRRIRATKASTP